MQTSEQEMLLLCVGVSRGIIIIINICIYIFQQQSFVEVRDFQRGTRFLKNCDTEEGCWLY